MFTRPLSSRTKAIAAAVLAAFVAMLVIVFTQDDETPQQASSHVNPPSNPLPSVSTATPIRAYDSRLDIGHNPAFNCPDGRNEGRQYNVPADLHQFVPCINGSLLIRVHPDGNLQVLNSTDKVEVHKIDADLREITTPTEGWRVHSYKLKVADSINDRLEKVIGQTYYQLTYDADPTLTPFQTYWLRDGKWQLAVNLNDKSFPQGSTTDVVFTWTDPERRNVEAPVPFKWQDVHKDPYYSLN